MPAVSRGLFLICLSLTLAGCQEDGPNSSSEISSVPDLLEGPRTECERSGGRWGARAGGVLFTCYRTTSDANRQCRAASDCESLCLARSRTCAPTEPFLGCHEIITDGGGIATQCIN